jgi:2-dehydropantoate 2-reductase
MKIAVVGTGAMGSIYAALLADAGNDVWAVDAWTDHVNAINRGGLRVSGPHGARTVTGLRATADIAEAGACDLYVVATKASAVADAARGVAAVMRPDSLVLTIQNGLGAGERIAQAVAADAVLLGVAEGFGASMAAPGHVTHTAMKLIRLGEMGGGISERLRAVEAVWRDAGFAVEAFADIDRLIWEKFLCNVTLSGPCTVFDCTVAELRARPDQWAVALGCLREAYAVGRAKNVAFSFDDAEAYVTAFAAAVGDARPSMLQDHQAGRVSELDAINGCVPVLGAELGIPTPYNETVSAVVRAREQTFGR